MEGEELQPSEFEIACSMLTSGTLNMLIESDFSLSLLVLNIYLLSSGEVYIGVASAYMVPFMNITVIAMMQGYNKTLQIYCTQYLTKQNYPRINLIFRQSIGLSIFSYLIISIPAAFVLPYLQRLLNIDEEAVEATFFLIITIIPAMALRIVGDSTKSILRGVGVFNLLGICINVCFIGFIFYSYVIMVYLDLGIFGFGLSLFIYELTSLISVTFLVFKYCYKEIIDNSLSWRTDLYWFFHESIKTVLPILTTWIISELAIIILTLTNSEVQLAAFGQLTNIPGTFFKLVGGYSGLFLKYLNTSLGNRQFKRAIHQIKVYIVCCMVIFSGYLVLLIGIAYIMIASYPEDSLVKAAIQGSVVPTLTYTFLGMFKISLYPCAFAFE